MYKSFLLVSSFFILNWSFAQNDNLNNHIEVHSDKRIDYLVEIERKTDQIDGYRLQICLDSNKDIVEEARNKFLKLYPFTDSDITFDNPHFNLKVGNFRSRIEAEKIKREVFGEFVICIIHDELINLPRID